PRLVAAGPDPDAWSADRGDAAGRSGSDPGPPVEPAGVRRDDRSRRPGRVLRPGGRREVDPDDRPHPWRAGAEGPLVSQQGVRMERRGPDQAVTTRTPGSGRGFFFSTSRRLQRGQVRAELLSQPAGRPALRFHRADSSRPVFRPASPEGVFQRPLYLDPVYTGCHYPLPIFETGVCSSSSAGAFVQLHSSSLFIVLIIHCSLIRSLIDVVV